MAPIDRSYATFYWSAIVSIALHVVPFSSDLTLNNYDLVKVKKRSFKLVPFERLGAVSYLPSIVTMAVSFPVYETFSIKEWCDVETGSSGGSRSLKMVPFDIITYNFLVVHHCK